MRTPALGDRELDIMAVLWEAGSGTVAEVREHLPTGLAYTTVLTILRNLEAKGCVRREEEGRAHRYYPRVALEAVRRSTLRGIVEKLFAGSPTQLMAHLVDEHGASPDAIARMRRRVGDRASSRRGRGGGGRRP